MDAIWANRLVIDDAGASSIAFPHPPRDRDCQSGLCKCQVLLGTGGKRVVIGDGLSDLCYASQADYCFAKGQLLAACRAQGIACFAFDNFTAVQGTLSCLVGDRTSTASLAR